jgi:hypothetical protein
MNLLFTDYEKDFTVNKDRFYLILIIQKYSRYIIKGKSGQIGKAIPLQAWTGPEGSNRPPDFKKISTRRQ